MHRAITSLMEELEAFDWYNQRVDACKDKELAAILAHNRDEEKEQCGDGARVGYAARPHGSLRPRALHFLFTDKANRTRTLKIVPGDSTTSGQNALLDEHLRASRRPLAAGEHPRRIFTTDSRPET